MDPDYRYDCALSAGLVILERLTISPDLPKHELLGVIIFSILHAMDRYEEERSDRRAGFSAN